MDVNLGGLDVFVTKPERDHRLIDTVVEQFHRRAVAKRMRCDPLGAEARACARCRQAMLAYQMFERVAAQPLAPDRWEQRPALILVVADPGRQQLSRFAAKRGGALLTALTHTADVRAGAERHITLRAANQLGCPQTSLDREQQQSMITPPRPCRAIRRCEQRPDLIRVKECDRTLHIALVGHGEDALAVQQPGWIGHRDEAEERSDRGQSGITAASVVAPRRFDMAEEVGNQIGVDVFDRQLDRRLATLRARISKQEPERVAVACNRVAACLQLRAKPVGEEALDQRRQGRDAHAIMGSCLWTVRIEPQKAPSDAVAESIEGCLSERLFDAHRREVLALLGLDAETATITGSDADGKAICGLVRRLIALDDAGVMRVLAVVMGETLDVGTGLIELLGQHMGVAMADVWQADDALLDAVRDREVMGLLLAEVVGEQVAAENAKATTKVQRGIIRDCLSGTNGRRKRERLGASLDGFPGIFLYGPGRDWQCRPCPAVGCAAGVEGGRSG